MQPERRGEWFTAGVIASQHGFVAAAGGTRFASCGQLFSELGNELVEVASTPLRQSAHECSKTSDTTSTDPDFDLLTTAEVASICRVSSRTILNWIKAGRLPALRLGNVYRVARRDLDDFILRNWIGEKSEENTTRNAALGKRSPDNGCAIIGVCLPEFRLFSVFSFPSVTGQ